MTLKLEYFPESYMALQAELPNHPTLCARVVRHSPADFELRIAEIALYCDVLLDGLYDKEDLNKICHILWRKLKEKDSGIILIN